MPEDGTDGATFSFWEGSHQKNSRSLPPLFPPASLPFPFPLPLSPFHLPAPFSSSPLSVPSVLLSTIVYQALKREGQRWWNSASSFIQQQSSLCVEMNKRQF